jgi:hypothetical protein
VALLLSVTVLTIGSVSVAALLKSGCHLLTEPTTHGRRTMPIIFPCPHCKEVLKVKDHLAGKKGPCPKCKKIVSVPLISSAGPPTPKTASTPTNGQTKANEPKTPVKPPVTDLPPEDAEAAAAAALADEPPPVEEMVAPKFIDFNCPQCDEPLHLSAELAGKRAPCPECKRIIKVPEIKKVEKADWRKTNAAGLPSGARRPDVPVPEGAWGSTAASRVSVEALEEANVLPDRYSQPLTLQQKIMRVVLAAGVFVFFIVIVGVAIGWWMSSRESRSLKSVQDYANSPAATQKIGREGVAALQIATGEYHLRAKKVEAAKEAQKHFGKAIDTLTPADGAIKASERDALLADLALLQIDLAGSTEEVNNKTRLNWNETQSAIGKTLRAMHNSEARLDAYRAVCRRLIAKKEGKRALALASQLSDAPAEKVEAQAVAGLEMLGAKDQALADEAAREALAPFGPEAGDRPLLTQSVVALAVALNREVPEPKNEAEILNTQIGRAVGQARIGDLGEARKAAGQFGEENSVARLRAFTELATAGEAKSDNPDLQEALRLAAGPLNPRANTAWLQLRVVDLAARAGVSEGQLNSVADAIKDPDIAGHARLIALKQKLADKNAGSPTPITGEPPTLAHYLSVQMIARHNRSFDSKGDDADRAFGVIGTLIASPSK